MSTKLRNLKKLSQTASGGEAAPVITALARRRLKYYPIVQVLPVQEVGLILLLISERAPGEQ